ncbi:Mif2/CENP-C like-domain-containing protein [Mycena belliarum]|uniref:CENP-C homolog n=1 Tax=Mycena belliarum TaxID=1033014 RepID=A0AAD6U211_9AGAR|nr:Mif2/CENP-C like-domain-containing protein [Mycena belliae]
MPPSARKSSVGAARRAEQKTHVPYRGDDPTVGKKTGISVQPVPRGSDGFEPFDQLMGQLGEAHAPRRTRKKKKRSSVSQADEDEDDEDGEMSMDVDSPIQNYSNARPPNTPRTPRPIARTSEVDFDQVPSPRPHGFAGRAGRTAGPSRLAQTAQELLEQDEDDDDDFGGGGGYDYAPADGDSPREVSFTEMDKGDGDEDEGQDELPVVLSSPKRGKGKGKATREVEHDSARGMEDVDMGQPDSDEEPQSPPKKAPPAKPKPIARPLARLQKENRDIPAGVRRSRRVPYAPLDWWRLERVEYGGRDPEGAPILCPTIKAIIRIPQEPVVPLGKHARRGIKKRARSTPAAEKIVEKIVEVPVVPVDPEEGWDDDTEPNALVKGYPDGKEVMRRIVFTAKMFSPMPAANNEWFFQKVFNDPDFVAAGLLRIPPKGRKPSKNTKDNTFIFFVIEGAVNLKVGDTSLIVASGGMFMVPRGNTYFIENIADRDAKLFFTQARKLREDEEEDAAPRGSSSASALPIQRAVSVAASGAARAKDKEPRRGMSLNINV